MLLKPHDIGQLLSAVKEALSRSAVVRQGKALSLGGGEAHSGLTS